VLEVALARLADDGTEPAYLRVRFRIQEEAMLARKSIIHAALVLGLVALTTPACAHDESSPRRSSRAAGAFDEAYDSVKSGAVEVAHAGEYVVERTGDAVVSAWRGTKEAARAARGGASDGWITTKVKSKYALSKTIHADDIDVDTRDGVVTLRGSVDSAWTASHAVREALDTKGVIEVRSSLTYPDRAPREKKWRD
jgi:osmotically-inducible protein OsmY